MTHDNGDSSVIRAAGGLVWRDSPRGKEVAVIHRARYGDWTLPKGKVKTEERWQEAAVREVWEETGCNIQVGSFAGSVSYTVKGVPKVVLFWNMSPVGECEFQPSEEVGEVVWLSIQEALAKLDYAGERRLLMDNDEILTSKPSLWSRIRKRLRTASLNRLAGSLVPYRQELAYLIKRCEIEGVESAPWASAAQALLDHAQQALEIRDEALGWRCFGAADRMSLFGLAELKDETALRAKARMVLNEATAKLRGWRSQTINEFLCKDGRLKDTLNAEEVFYASQVLHEHFANIYHKIRLARGQLATLALIGFLAVILWIAVASPLPGGVSMGDQEIAISAAEAEQMNEKQTPVSMGDQEVAISAVLFGIMGAAMSGILSLARGSSGARIPEQLLGFFIVLARFGIAAVGALAVYAFLVAGLLPQLGEVSTGLVLAASFAAGFSERLVVRAVEEIVPKQKP